MRHLAGLQVIFLYVILGACASEHSPTYASPEQELETGQALLRFEFGNDPSRMHNAGVRVIQEDGEGNLWFGTHLDGIARFDGQAFTYFDVSGGERGLSRAFHIALDADGEPWFKTGHGYAHFDGERMTHHRLRDSPRAEAWTLEEGDLWFAASDRSKEEQRRGEVGIYRHDGVGFSYLPIPVPEAIRSGKDFEIVGMWRGNGARIWLATWEEVLGYDGKSLTVIDDERLGHTDATGYLHVKCMYEDSQDRVWIGNNGIGVVLLDGDRLTNFTQEHGLGRRDHRSGGKGMQPLPGDAPEGAPTLHRVFSIGEDAEGAIWFGTTKQGAWRYDGKSVRQFHQQQGLELDHVASFYSEPSGSLLMGGLGVYRFDGTSFERAY